ncbi:DUF1349 domain-containing protein [Pleomorphovibrio marinus]|uniref:DUF1349 domain-containing protein n=1 Tax=Pleomorphovibrio marinus TaxID=2164132 RepID=UPI000E0B8FB2|nr:DUF1349 domain-containing protein [Pleomorphovibrio marinus]
MQDNPWDWINPPKEWVKEGQVMRLVTSPDTDFWVKTHYGFIRHSGHFYHSTKEGDFEISCKFTGRYLDQYDQAGLMLLQDKENWIKAGVEYVDGRQNISAVITHGYSDWSVLPLEEAPADIYFKLRREGDFVEASYSLDGGDYSMYRLGYFIPSQPIKVGIMAASPEGKGFEVLFQDVSIKGILG